MNILYVGKLHLGSTSLQRCTAFSELGHRVTAISPDPENAKSIDASLKYRILRKLLIYPDLNHVNARVAKAMENQAFDVLWLDKALCVWPETLKFVRKNFPTCLIAGYACDDMKARHNQSRNFLRGLSYYDAFFTTKSFGVRELTAMGCPRVFFSPNGYDPNFHRPLSLSLQEKARLGGLVGFIGTWESQREQSIRKLAQAGLPVRVWGNNWPQLQNCPPPLKIEYAPVEAEDYLRAISSFDINLGFLRKINRDQQTNRSLEIPACGGFFLAERTEEHLALFKEGKEAEFFSSDAELIQKAIYYRDHTDERIKISKAGRLRCLTSGYSYPERLRTALAELIHLKKAA